MLADDGRLGLLQLELSGNHLEDERLRPLHHAGQLTGTNTERFTGDPLGTDASPTAAAAAASTHLRNRDPAGQRPGLHVDEPSVLERVAAHREALGRKHGMGPHLHPGEVQVSVSQRAVRRGPLGKQQTVTFTPGGAVTSNINV